MIFGSLCLQKDITDVTILSMFFFFNSIEKLYFGFDSSGTIVAIKSNLVSSRGNSFFFYCLHQKIYSHLK